MQTAKHAKHAKSSVFAFSRFRAFRGSESKLQEIYFPEYSIPKLLLNGSGVPESPIVKRRHKVEAKLLDPVEDDSDEE
ncbi:MAG TPA: hypothetical protein VJ302_31740 [Blastocatellia bacterium]|nr:hypothetical protein [Blastocatellia bacterium]